MQPKVSVLLLVFFVQALSGFRDGFCAEGLSKETSQPQFLLLSQENFEPEDGRTELCNGLTAMELKNKEEHVWLFLGAACVIGLVAVVKVIDMFSGLEQKTG